MSQVFYIGQKVIRTTEYYGFNDRPMCRGSIYTVAGVSSKGQTISVKEVDGEYSAENFRPAGWQDRQVDATPREKTYTVSQVLTAWDDLHASMGAEWVEKTSVNVQKRLDLMENSDYIKYLELKKQFENT